MQIIKSNRNILALLQEIGSLEYTRDDTGVLMSNAQSLFTAHMRRLREVTLAVAEIEFERMLECAYVMVNIVPPGIEVPSHTDTLKRPAERWHLPLLSNDACGYWDGVDGHAHMDVGSWTGPVPYHLEHRIWNLGVTERIHLVVDLEVK
jgi:hypothetical protein